MKIEAGYNVRVSNRGSRVDRGAVIFVLGLGPDRRASHDRQNRAEAPAGLNSNTAAERFR